MQSDSIGLLGGINTYLYALANPLKYVDDNGEMPCLPDDHNCRGGIPGPGRTPTAIDPNTGGCLDKKDCPPAQPCEILCFSLTLTCGLTDGLVLFIADAACSGSAYLACVKVACSEGCSPPLTRGERKQRDKNRAQNRLVK